MKKIVPIFVLLIGAGLVLALSSKIPSRDKGTPVSVVSEETIQDGKYCFFRLQNATEEAPYRVEEYMVINIAGNAITGTKAGTQEGPDMTNGYQGYLEGTKEENILELTYSYKVEGSENKELEVYEMTKNMLTKKRWQLKEENGILVPDKTTDPSLIPYGREECRS